MWYIGGNRRGVVAQCGYNGIEWLKERGVVYEGEWFKVVKCVLPWGKLLEGICGVNW